MSCWAARVVDGTLGPPRRGEAGCASWPWPVGKQRALPMRCRVAVLANQSREQEPEPSHQKAGSSCWPGQLELEPRDILSGEVLPCRLAGNPTFLEGSAVILQDLGPSQHRVPSPCQPAGAGGRTKALPVGVSVTLPAGLFQGWDPGPSWQGVGSLELAVGIWAPLVVGGVLALVS